MARRKNAPESVRVKHNLSERLRDLRTQFYGERGGPDLARVLGIPVRTWYNYETGVTVPAEIILRIVELTAAEPVWLLRGEGPKFRPKLPTLAATGLGQDFDGSTIPMLLRAALERLEERERLARDAEPGPEDVDLVLTGMDGALGAALTPADGVRYQAARREWIAARKASRHLRVSGDEMTPIVAEGAIVAYAEAEPASEAFGGRLVVAWIDDKPAVRWFQHCGRFALLKAENPAANPASNLVDLEGPEAPKFHRVLWITTPH